MDKIRFSGIDVFVYRAPIDEPVTTSFGVMTSRPAVFVRLTDQDGAFGWGEIFANWPTAGAEHRARLLIEDIADLVLGYESETPSDLFHFLTAKTHIRALQCGEWGPFRQVIAGLDTASHDLFSRRAGLPLARFLNSTASMAVPAYASGIHIASGSRVIPVFRAQGYSAFKVKIGFSHASDLDQLRVLVDNLAPGERLYTDANQAWDLDSALAFVSAANDLGLGWIEEPLRADAPVSDWAEIAKASTAPIAVGENIAGFDDFDEAIQSGHFAVVQPDVAKWGGITGCYGVAQRVRDAGRLYCPHFLGGGLGLLASAHLLAATGGDGLLEVDVNPNPLRDAFLGPDTIQSGIFSIPDAPGMGCETLPDDIAKYLTLSLSAR